MRNGNLYLGLMILLAVSGSYRTYEEWKHEIFQCRSILSDSSYRTYEEWKQCSSALLVPSLTLVLTVPMRNGNILHLSHRPQMPSGSYRTYEEWKLT